MRSLAAEQTLLSLLGTGDGEHVALVADRALTFAGLRASALEIAGLLSEAGVHRGSCVALVAGNGPEFLELLFGITALGAAAAPLNPAYTEEEHAFYLGDLRPSLVLVPEGEGRAARAAAATAAIDIVEFVAPRGGGLVLRRRGRDLRPGTPDRAAGPDDIALLLHTSGTTGRPKQVPLLHGNVVASTRQIVETYRLGEEDVSYCAMPLFHVHGLVASALAALRAGGSVVVPRRLAPHRFWGELAQTGATWFSATPTVLQMLLDAGASPPESRPALRFARTSSSALAPALHARAEQLLGVPVVEAYGMTEASHQIASNPLPPGRRVPGSVGPATGPEVRVLDELGDDVAPGAIGEVAIRGPGVTPGYLGDPEANARAFIGRWFRTGDLGKLEGGYLSLEGRLKELINRGGEKISPYEVEHALLTHAAVAEAVCFGVPDEKYGEEVAAAVVLAFPVANGELVEHCRERLAPFKIPRKLLVVDSIPRTATGKVQRRHLSALAGP